MKLEAPAKLNRFLAILQHREDGFHELELVTTVLGGVPELTDTLHAQPSSTLILKLSGPMSEGLEGGDDNLVLRAWHLLELETGRLLPAFLHLEKQIPSGAGLGGGSSDAAAALKLGNALFNLELDSCTLLRLAAELGSDVPLFLLGGTVLGLGRGDRVFPLKPLSLEPILLVHPGLHVPTPSVYRALAFVGYPEPKPCPGLLEGVRPPWRNDLTEAALWVCPELAEVQNALQATGGEPLLCGSGSCWAARYESATHRDEALGSLHTDHAGWSIWAV
jgi:4-diphosphocytidyl-2-C-methyl-D-erythritol kinase